MATRAVYRLLDTGRLTGPHDGHRFRTGGRTAWEFTFDMSELDGITDVTVRIEASPTGNVDSEYETIHETVLSSEATTTISTAFSGRDVTKRDVYIRGIVSAVTGTGHYVVRVFAASPWLDPTDDHPDLLYLRREIRSYDDTGTGEGRTRIVERAEADVMVKLRQGADGGLRLADLNRSGALETMKEAVAIQAEHLFKREMLMQSREPNSAEAAERMPRYAPTLDGTLTGVLWNGTGGVWRGR